MTTSARSPLRFGLAGAILISALAVVALRLCQLALVDGERLARLARRQHSGTVEVKSLRGSILDRDGEALAISIDAPSVFVRPRELPDGPAADAVPRTLGMSNRAWIQKISSPAPFVWVKRQASPDELERLRDLAVPGVGTLLERRRFYPHGRLASSLLGFVGVDSQGLEGIELSYDRLLRGSSAELGVERDALGRKLISTGGGEGPRRGADVTLTIDSAIQFVAERELDRQVRETRAKGGVVIVLDPTTGEILALAQNPSIDPNRIRERGRFEPDDWRNRAVADAYEPGSTMKGLLAAAALDEGVARPGERFFCENGAAKFGGRTVHDHHRHGWLTFTEVFQVSSNICSAKIGGRLGVKRYHDRLRAFGLGSPTGIDVAGEQAGIVRPPSEWRAIDLATASFGHGVAVTPIQLAAAYGALANRGILMQPHVVRQVRGDEGEVLVDHPPRIVRRVVAEGTARRVTEILETVVGPKGTAPAAAIPGVRVAGKTGTAQKVDLVNGGYGRGRIASFVGYFPAEEPAAVILVVMDEPRTTVWGGTAAAPVFRAVAQASLERLGVRPSSMPVRAMPAAEIARAARSLEHEATTFVGLSLREAVARAHEAGLEVELVGSGYVVRQDPAPGPELEPGGRVRLELSPEGSVG